MLHRLFACPKIFFCFVFPLFAGWIPDIYDLVKLCFFQAVLGSIIMVSLKGIFMQFQDFVCYSKRSFSEAFIWMATFLSTVFLDVDLGLLVGLSVSLMFLVAWGYFPRIELVGKTEYDDLFLQGDKFQKVTIHSKNLISCYCNYRSFRLWFAPHSIAINCKC